MKIALVHDWLNGMRGGENVLEAFCDMYPDAVIYTLFCDRDMISDKIRRHRIVTSYIQNVPLRKSLYRHYLPLFPGAIERFDFTGYDLVISTSHCVAKGAKAGTDALHICYCFSPMRYVWDRFDDYFPKDRINPLRYQFISRTAERLRSWDQRSSERVDLFVADSKFVKKRIDSFYGRPSKVIFPPVDTEFYTPCSGTANDYYLLAGALVPYKKGDIVVEAFREFNEKLIVTGDGPDLDRLKKSATPNIRFTGWIDKTRLREYYRGCKALIFPGVEDFGIMPVEAQACGKPVIAFNRGGALDTVIGPTTENYENHDGFKSGLFFTEQSPESIRNAIEIFQKMKFDGDSINRHASEFSKNAFSNSISHFISRAYDQFSKSGKTGLEGTMIS